MSNTRGKRRKGGIEGEGQTKKGMGERKRGDEMRELSIQTAMKQHDTLANQSAVFFFHKLSSWPSSHQDLVPLPLSLTDFPVQLFKVYKQEPSIQLAADPVK